ncbi:MULTISPECIES: PPK2 family polyphosphate kinase [unclassified Streptomyces]|uniref:PPK2 family polyphosphate kinase n=1 Tax=unclassified Streptomyces TaxID=2593676 RepID=UPI0033A8D550
MRKDRTSLGKRLRVPVGEPVDLSAQDAAATSGGPDGKAAGKAATARIGERLSGLQERLWAASTAGDRRRVLLILQGMDTSGRGGTVKHVIGLLNPSGCRVTAFRAPTAEERAHPFLWRVEKALPLPGELGIFDRSLPHSRLRSSGRCPHRGRPRGPSVRGLAPAAEIDRRYELINRFEKSLADDGVTLVKCFLHLSYEEQRRRLLKRLDRPEKRWKFAPSDIDDLALWPAYQEAYEIALERCGTAYAPWYLVPADHRWYRDWAVSTLLLERLRELDPRYPEPDFDVAECRKRLLRQP